MNALFEGMCHKIKDIESEEEERFAEYTQKTGDRGVRAACGVRSVSGRLVRHDYSLQESWNLI